MYYSSTEKVGIRLLQNYLFLLKPIDLCLLALSVVKSVVKKSSSNLSISFLIHKKLLLQQISASTASISICLSVIWTPLTDVLSSFWIGFTLFLIKKLTNIKHTNCNVRLNFGCKFFFWYVWIIDLCQKLDHLPLWYRVIF